MCLLCIEYNKNRLVRSRDANLKERARQVKEELNLIEAGLTSPFVTDEQREHLVGIQTTLREEQYELSQKL